MFKQLITLTIVLLIPLLVAAQTDEEFFEGFNNRFNFATPGSRATAMGRAFIGLADDATAAYSNPAGLVLLTKPEVSFEFKSTNAVVNRLALRDSSSSNTSNKHHFFSCDWKCRVQRYKYRFGRSLPGFF